jgi:hypothetical protein
VVIVPILAGKATEAVLEASRKVAAALKAAGVRVELDDSEKKPGDKSVTVCPVWRTGG